MRTHICIHVYIYIYVHTREYAFICLNICMYIYLIIYTHTHAPSCAENPQDAHVRENQDYQARTRWLLNTRFAM